MQLILLLALLALGGNKNGGQLLGELKPMLENFGGEELKSAFSEVEKLSGVLSAVQAVASSVGSAPQQQREEESAREPSNGFPLAPIAPFADRDITYSLSQYISEQA